jgi:hypothetical protein
MAGVPFWAVTRHFEVALLTEAVKRFESRFEIFSSALSNGQKKHALLCSRAVDSFKLV